MDIFVYLTLCFHFAIHLDGPFGVMPVFLQMTDGMDLKNRYIALKACTIAFIILVLLHYRAGSCFIFGISTNGFRIVEVSSSFKSDMICCRHISPAVKLNETERKEKYSKDITITPLAIPMLCGRERFQWNNIDGRCWNILSK